MRIMIIDDESEIKASFGADVEEYLARRENWDAIMGGQEELGMGWGKGKSGEE